MNRSLSLVFLLSSVFGVTGHAEQHVFTNKDGVTIVAEIVSVNPDWKKMTIRKDGNSFDIEPKVLILDDQQYVKNWLKSRGIVEPLTGTNGSTQTSTGAGSPMRTIDPDSVKLNVDLKKKQVDSDRHRYSSYMRFDTRKYEYDITVTSGGREPLPAVNIGYALVWKEGVSFIDGGNSYSTFSSTRNKFAIKGQKSYPGLAYNRSETFTLT